MNIVHELRKGREIFEDFKVFIECLSFYSMLRLSAMASFFIERKISTSRMFPIKTMQQVEGTSNNVEIVIFMRR